MVSLRAIKKIKIIKENRELFLNGKAGIPIGAQTNSEPLSWESIFLTLPYIEPTLEWLKVERWPSANSPQIKRGGSYHAKPSKLFIARTLLCATIVALSAQGQPARSSGASSVPSTRSFEILCQPGFIRRCNELGCFCVRP